MNILEFISLFLKTTDLQMSLNQIQNLWVLEAHRDSLQFVGSSITTGTWQLEIIKSIWVERIVPYLWTAFTDPCLWNKPVLKCLRKYWWMSTSFIYFFLLCISLHALVVYAIVRIIGGVLWGCSCVEEPTKTVNIAERGST